MTSEVIALDFLCEAIVDCEHKTAPVEDEGIPSIRTTDIRGGVIDFKGANKISEETYQEWTKRREPKEGDLIFCREAPVGEVGRLRRGQRAALGQRTVLLCPDKQKVDPRYLHYLLMGYEVQYLMDGWSTGSTVAHLNVADIRKLPIPFIHDIDDQKFIGGLLDRIDVLRQKMSETSAITEQIISSLFRSWFIDFDPVKAKAEGEFPYGMDEETALLFPDSFEDSDFGLIPKGWKLQQLSDIAQIVDCSHATKPEPIDTGYGVLLHVWNIDDSGGITLHETFEVEEKEFNSWASRMVLGEGDCVVTKTGRVAAVGRIPHNLDRNLAMGRNMIGIRMENAPGFLYAYLMSPLKEMEVIKWLNSGTVMPSLHVKYAERLSVIVPSKDILAKFEELVEPLIRLIDDSRAESISLSSCRDVLLPRLMSGELKVN